MSSLTNSFEKIKNIKETCTVYHKLIQKMIIIRCQMSNAKIRIKCNNTDIKIYNKIKRDNLHQNCNQCQKGSTPNSSHPNINGQDNDLPFQKLSDTQFIVENSAINFTPLTPITKKSCEICTKTIAKNHRHITCQSCHVHVHIKCNNTDTKTYNELIQNKLPQYCYKCHPEPTLRSIRHRVSCGVCSKNIAKNHRNIQCISCNSYIH